MPSPENPYLAGNFAPVSEELTVERPLPVDGAIPPVLEGLLVRNGPNPYLADLSTYRWADGDGMVHAIELREGQAVSYRNRWIRTRRLAALAGTAPPRGPAEPTDGPANSHVLWCGGRLLAVGDGFPHRLTTDLDTVCIDDLDGMLASPMTGRPHVDPVTGGMAFVGADPFGPPFLRYHETDRTGALVHTAEVETARPTLQHDLGVTATRVVLLDFPAVLDPVPAPPDPASPEPGPAAHGARFRWVPEAGSTVGVLDRGRPGDEVRWSAVEPSYVSHVANAYDDGDDVVLDVCRYERVPDNPLHGPPAVLERWRIGAGRVTTAQLDDRSVELPGIDETLAGRPHRYVYCVEVTGGGFGGLARYDLVRDEVARWDPGPFRAAGEPVFVRDPDGHSDDEGWILSIVYDAERGASDLVILDGSSWTGRTEAIVHLPCRVPFGFHGSWVPADRYR